MTSLLTKIVMRGPANLSRSGSGRSVSPGGEEKGGKLSKSSNEQQDQKEEVKKELSSNSTNPWRVSCAKIVNCPQSKRNNSVTTNGWCDKIAFAALPTICWNVQKKQ